MSEERELSNLVKAANRSLGAPKLINRKGTSELRKMIIGALHMAGGVNYLHRQAERNPVAFLGLLGKILPSELRVEADAKGDGPVTISVSWLEGSDRLSYHDDDAPLDVLARPVEGFEDLSEGVDSPEAPGPVQRLGADELW